MSNENSVFLTQEFVKNALLEVVETFPAEFVFEPPVRDEFAGDDLP